MCIRDRIETGKDEDNTMSVDLLAMIEGKMSSFSKGQKLIARYIIEHYDKAAFMTASKLGQDVYKRQLELDESHRTLFFYVWLAEKDAV